MGSWTSSFLYTGAGLFAAQKVRQLYRHLLYGRNAQQRQDFSKRYEEVKRKREKIREDFIATVAGIYPNCREKFEKPESWLVLTERSAEDQINDFALAEERGKLLLELTTDALYHIPKLPNEVAEKYLIKTIAYPMVYKPFVFSPFVDNQGGGSYIFPNVPSRFKWNIKSVHQHYMLIFELKEWCSVRKHDAPYTFKELLEFREFAPIDFLGGIVPIGRVSILWAILHIVPCLLHDYMAQSTWSLKYVLGGVSYLLSLLFSSIATTDQRDILIVLAAVFYGVQCLYLPWKLYPTSLHYFNFQQIFLLAFGYYQLVQQYAAFAKLSSTQKRITNLILLALLGFSNNWSRFLDIYTNTPEVFLSALKANSISAGIMFMNYYFYYVGRLFVGNDSDTLSVVFNWNGETLAKGLGLMLFGALASVYYPHVIS